MLFQRAMQEPCNKTALGKYSYLNGTKLQM